MFKALDIVKAPSGVVGIVTETNTRVDGSQKVSVDWFKGQSSDEKTAWWDKDDGLVLLDSLPRVLASAVAHPFGGGQTDVDSFFPIEA